MLIPSFLQKTVEKAKSIRMVLLVKAVAVLTTAAFIDSSPFLRLRLVELRAEKGPLTLSFGLTLSI